MLFSSSSLKSINHSGTLLSISLSNLKYLFEQPFKNNAKIKIKESIITQVDAKTKLQEFSLKKFKKLPTYKVVSNTGPRHKPILKVGVKLPDTKFYIAEGSSKKDAEQNAAILCLNNNL